MEIFSAMVFMALTDSLTDLLLSAMSLDPFKAICSICREFSAFCVIEAFISSRLAVVSSTAAACSLVDCVRFCAEAAISLEASDRESAVLITHSMDSWRLSAKVL